MMVSFKIEKQKIENWQCQYNDRLYKTSNKKIYKSFNFHKRETTSHYEHDLNLSASIHFCRSHGFKKYAALAPNHKLRLIKAQYTRDTRCEAIIANFLSLAFNLCFSDSSA